MSTAPNMSLCILCYINDMKSGTACCFIYYFSFHYFSCFPSYLICLYFLLFCCIQVYFYFSYFFLLFSMSFPSYCISSLELLFLCISFSFLFYPSLTLVSFISHSPSLIFFHFSWYLLFSFLRITLFPLLVYISPYCGHIHHDVWYQPH